MLQKHKGTLKMGIVCELVQIGKTSVPGVKEAQKREAGATAHKTFQRTVAVRCPILH